MKKRMLVVIYALIVILFSRQALNVFYNRHIINQYNNKDYSDNVNLLKSFNCFEPYIAYYNNGNIYYMNGMYEEAASEYSEALDYSFIPDYRDCKIRINWALALVKPLKPVEEYVTVESIDQALEVLYGARDILLENGCADDFDTGHNDKAQQLKNDIDEMIRQLEERRDELQQAEETTEPSDSSESSESSDQSQSSDQSETSNQSETSQSNESSQMPESSQTSQSGGPSESSESSQTSQSGGPSESSESSQTSQSGGPSESSESSQTSQSSGPSESSGPSQPSTPWSSTPTGPSQTGPVGTTSVQETTSLPFDQWESQMRESIASVRESAYNERVDELQEYEEAENGRYSGYEDIW